MADFEGELDEIETDMVSQERDVIWPWEAQRVADEWAGHFEQELEAHWTAPSQARKPVPSEDGQKMWASTWTHAGDVAYNLAYLKSVALLALHFLLLGFTEARHHSPSYLRWIDATFLHPGHHIPHHLRHHFRHHLGNGLSGEGYDQPPAYCAQESSKYITPAVRNRIVHLSCLSLSCLPAQTTD
jgi:hypothetical protein